MLVIVIGLGGVVWAATRAEPSRLSRQLCYWWSRSSLLGRAALAHFRVGRGTGALGALGAKKQIKNMIIDMWNLRLHRKLSTKQ